MFLDRIIVIVGVFFSVGVQAQSVFYFDNSRRVNLNNGIIFNSCPSSCYVAPRPEPECETQSGQGPNSCRASCSVIYSDRRNDIPAGANSEITITHYSKRFTQSASAHPCSPASATVSLPSNFRSDNRGASSRQVRYIPVRFKLNTLAGNPVVCPGTSLDLSTLLVDGAEKGGGASWSGPGVSRGVFRMTAPGKYRLTCSRDFVNGRSSLSVEVEVPDITLGKPIEAVCEKSTEEVLLTEEASFIGLTSFSIFSKRGNLSVKLSVSDKLRKVGQNYYLDISSFQSGKYVVKADYRVKDCSLTQEKEFTIKPKPPVVRFSEVARCGEGEVSLDNNRILSEDRGKSLGSLNFYPSESGGQQLSNPLTVASSKTVYAEFSADGCQSDRIPVPITVNTPPVMRDTAFTRCGAGTLTVDLDENGFFSGKGWNDVSWYNAREGGRLLRSGYAHQESFEDAQVGSLGSRDRYITFTDANGCSPTERVRIRFHAESTPSAPDIGNAYTCGPGKVRLRTPALGNRQQLLFYDEINSTSTSDAIRPSSENPLIYETNELDLSRSFFAAIDDQTLNCSSLRVEVKTSVLPLPDTLSFRDDFTVCAGDDIVLGIDRVGIEKGGKKEEFVFEHPDTRLIWRDAEGTEVAAVGPGETQNVAATAPSSWAWQAVQRDQFGCESVPAKDSVTLLPIQSVFVGPERSDICLDAEPVNLEQLLDSPVRNTAYNVFGVGLSGLDPPKFDPKVALGGQVGETTLSFAFTNAEDQIKFSEKPFCYRGLTKTFSIVEIGEARTDNLEIQVSDEGDGEAYFGYPLTYTVRDKEDEELSFVLYEWDLGEDLGIFRTEKNRITHHYYDPGVKEITVRARLSSGCVATLSLDEAVDIVGWKPGEEAPVPEVITAVQSDRSGFGAQAEVWPNPVGDRLYVRLPVKGKMNYTVYDLSGRVMLEGFFESAYGAERAVDMSPLKNGMYYLRVADKLIKLWKR